MAQIHNPPIYHLVETYTGARATTTLVGRRDILPGVVEAIHQKKTTSIIYFTGQGGTGKTKLIQHILTLVADDANLLVANDLIDLYHTRNRSVGGIIESMLAVVGEIGNYIKSKPDQKQVPDHKQVDVQLSDLARAEQEGLSTHELVSRRQELTKNLLKVFNDFTRERRLVLALDTAERLFVARDVAQQMLGLSEERPAVLDWLLQEFLPNIQNAVILLAGRPQPLNLTTDLRKIAKTAGEQFLSFDLRGLNEAEALEYFEAVIQRSEKSSNPSDQQAAAAIRSWSLDERRAIFYCLCDSEAEPRIRPILLALAIDHLVVAGRPLSTLTRSLQIAQNLSQAERQMIADELGQELVQTLREFRRPADDIIITLGWLRKGADVALLARLTELTHAEVEESIAQIRELSFVKIRPSDQRIFLHDEMYELLRRNVLDRISPVEKEQTFATLRDYYRELIQAARQQIEKLYRPQHETFGETFPEPTTVRAARAALQDAMVDDFFYRLRWDPADAFEKYIIYATEALVGSDESLWVLLRAELFGFWAEHDPQDQAEVINGLRRVDIVADSAVRWLMWLQSHERYAEALQTADKAVQHAAELIDPGGAIAQAHFLAWRGFINVFANNPADAEQFFNQALQLLNQWALQNKKGLRWVGVLARTYNGMGYLYSQQRQHYQAIEAFGQAVQYWRKIGLAIEEANSLNNRAFDLSKIGRFHVALPLAYAALQLREELGPRNPVGLSINTISLIELAQYDITGSLRDSERSYEIFERLNSNRGLGLALLAQAEAKRRTSVSVVHLQQGKSAQFLAEALADAEAAIQIFTTQVEEPSRRIEALREKGRVYRDWAKLRRENPNIISKTESIQGKQSVEQLAQLSQTAFAEAIMLAQKNSYVLADLLLSQAKLTYYVQLYVGAPDYAQAQGAMEQGLLATIETTIAPEYHLPPTQNSNIPKTWSLVQAGGLAHLRGHLAFNRWVMNSNDLQWLGEAIKQYTFTLAFYHYFSNDTFQEMREAQDQIYEQINRLTAAQQHKIYQFVAETERTYQLGIGQSAMSNFLQNRFGEPIDLEIEI